MAHLRHTYSSPKDIASVHRDTNYDAYQLPGRSSPRVPVVHNTNSMLQTVSSKTGNISGYQNYAQSTSNYTHSISNPVTRQSSKGTHGSNAVSGFLTTGAYNTDTSNYLSSLERSHSPYDVPSSSVQSPGQYGEQDQNRPPSPSLRGSIRRNRAQDDSGAAIGVTYIKNATNVDRGPSSLPVNVSTCDTDRMSVNTTNPKGTTSKGSTTARWAKNRDALHVSKSVKGVPTTNSTTSHRPKTVGSIPRSSVGPVKVKRPATVETATALPNKAMVDTSKRATKQTTVTKINDSYKRAVGDEQSTFKRGSVYDNVPSNTSQHNIQLITGNTKMTGSVRSSKVKGESNNSGVNYPVTSVGLGESYSHTAIPSRHVTFDSSNGDLSSFTRDRSSTHGSRDNSYDEIKQSFSNGLLTSDAGSYPIAAPRRSVSVETQTKETGTTYSKEQVLDIIQDYKKAGQHLKVIREENDKLRIELRQNADKVARLIQTQEERDTQVAISETEKLHLEDRIKDLERKCKKLEELNGQTMQENNTMAKRIEGLTMRLSAQMQKEMSKDERNIESIADKYRPSVIIDNYTMLCSNEWLEVAEAIEYYSRRANADSPRNYKKLCDVFLEVNEVVSEHIKGKIKAVKTFLLDPFSTARIEMNGEMDEISRLIHILYRQNIDYYNTSEIVKEATQAIEKKKIFAGIPKFTVSSRFRKFVAVLCDLCFKMELQRPAMSFSIQGARGKLDESIQEIQYGCRPQTSRPVVAFYTKPLLMHGDKIVAKGAVWLTDM